MKKLAIILGALALFVVQPVAGQTFTPVDPWRAPVTGDQLKYDGLYGNPFNPVAYGAYTGPYKGSFPGYPGSPQFTMYCVDFETNVINTAWTITVEQVAPVHHGGTWHQVSFLASLFAVEDVSQFTAIHGAIWHLTSPTQFNLAGRSATVRTAINSYLARDFLTFTDYHNWYILRSDPQGTSQNFIVRHSVPEPGVIVLLLSGLLGVAFVARRRSAQFS